MKILKCVILLLSIYGYSQNTYYISQNDGSDFNNGMSIGNAFKTINEALNHLNPGDTLLFLGEFTNISYNPNYSYTGNINDTHIWHQENTIRINNLNGTADNYITLKAYDSNTILKGDGANIFRVTNSSYLKIVGFEIYGEVERIPLSTALSLQFLYREEGSVETQYRVPPGTSDNEVENMTFPLLNNITRPSYTDTRGIYFSNVHHIDFFNNLIHDLPGNGFRVASCDYINIIGNEIYHTSRKSYSGTHALVVTNALSFDTYNGYKIFIEKNKVHHNYNEIYSWSPSKTFITPRIDEGKGISLQRNDLENGWSHGRFLVANNVTYWNGFSGLHSNTGLRIDFINNTSYLNSFTNSITYAGGEQKGNNIGMSAQGGEDNKFINNIIYIDNTWGGYPISLADEINDQVSDNMIFGINGPLNQDSDVTNIDANTIVANPLFVDADNFDFNLQNTSPAIGLANTFYAVVDDYFGNIRDANPDLGAFEFNSALGIENYELTKLKVFPNPFKDIVYISGLDGISNIEVYELTGKKINVLTCVNKLSVLDFSNFSKGLYIVKINSKVFKLIKI